MMDSEAQRTTPVRACRDVRMAAHGFVLQAVAVAAR